MRSGAERSLRSQACAVAMTLLMAAAAPTLAAAPGQAPTRQEVKSAVDEVGKDLADKRIEKQLRFKKQDEPARKKGDKERKEEAWPVWTWLFEFVRWLSEAGRVLMWLVGAFVLAVVLLRLWRWSRVRAQAAALVAAPLPSHVQSLDIRPASLPDAVGAAAAALWARGEQRAALSLLYRGGLSRLVHAHGVPIRAASTEGECLAMASHRLEAPVAGFFARVVAAWQRAVYGARMPEADDVLAICRDFDRYFAAPAAAADGGAA